MTDNDFAYSSEEQEQPFSERKAIVRSDYPMSQMREARAVDRHYAPTGPTQAWIEPEDANRVRHVFWSIAPLVTKGKRPWG